MAPHDSFLGVVVDGADRHLDQLLGVAPESELRPANPRELMRQVKALVGGWSFLGSRHYRNGAALVLAEQRTRALRARQGKSGLFAGSGNLESPPDSAFALNDLADAHFLTAGPDEAAGLRAALGEIAAAATDALLRGGVHTPNHRWELAAALARFHRSWPDSRLRDRAEEWVAEGIDIDADGFYSERSPNYASHVSNRSLIAIGEIFDRPDLLKLVERNLTATLDLIRPDGGVETVQSRRQDQGARFPLSAYLLQFRQFAIRTGRGDLSWAAHLALTDPPEDAGRALAEVGLHPELGSQLPDPEPPAPVRSRVFPSVGLASFVNHGVHAVVYGGSDYHRFHRIRSGLANDPTFLRFFAGDAVLDAVRLSRDFFGLGPFRADHVTWGEEIRLDETVEAFYYQPLPPGARSEDGGYVLSDEGRFSASMGFASRAADRVQMTTSVSVHPREDGMDVAIDIAGPDTSWALELTFRPPGTLSGVDEVGPGSYELREGFGSYQVGRDSIVFGPGNGTSPDHPPAYRPGQDYAFVGGTDATRGHHVYVTGRAPGTYRLTLRATVV